MLDQSELARYQGFVSTLRNEGIAAELYLGSSGMNAQLKYADKRNAVCAIIQGSNEREKGEIAIRDLVLGAELAASIEGARGLSRTAHQGAVLGARGRSAQRREGSARPARVRQHVMAGLDPAHPRANRTSMDARPNPHCRSGRYATPVPGHDVERVTASAAAATSDPTPDRR